jgi:hypothetical protein
MGNLQEAVYRAGVLSRPGPAEQKLEHRLMALPPVPASAGENMLLMIGRNVNRHVEAENKFGAKHKKGATKKMEPGATCGT